MTAERSGNRADVGTQPGTVDDSFIEWWFKAFVEWIDEHLGLTRHVMRLLQRPPFKVRHDGWAQSDIAHLAGLILTYAILPWCWLGDPAGVPGALAVAYVALRLVDIFSYELRIIFIDRHRVPEGQGHLLSVDRLVLFVFMRIADFIGLFALLYLAMQGILGDRTFNPSIGSPVAALYLSIVVGSFTGLATSVPNTDWARLVVGSEVLLGLMLLGLLFAAVVGSLGQLTEIRPRPPRPRRHVE